MSRRLAAVLAAAIALALAAGYAVVRHGTAPVSNDAASTAGQSQEPIGAARMLDDGTIVMDLYLRHGEAVGHAQATYRKDHPEYTRVLQHLGKMRPGEEKLVPPFPDE